MVKAIIIEKAIEGAVAIISEIIEKVKLNKNEKAIMSHNLKVVEEGYQQLRDENKSLRNENHELREQIEELRSKENNQ